jgi:hypothetical protein
MAARPRRIGAARVTPGMGVAERRFWAKADLNEDATDGELEYVDRRGHTRQESRDMVY